MLGGPPDPQCEALTKDRHLRLRFPVPFNRANTHAGLAHVALAAMLGTCVALFSGPIRPSLCTILQADLGGLTFWALG